MEEQDQKLSPENKSMVRPIGLSFLGILLVLIAGYYLYRSIDTQVGPEVVESPVVDDVGQVQGVQERVWSPELMASLTPSADQERVWSPELMDSLTPSEDQPRVWSSKTIAGITPK